MVAHVRSELRKQERLTKPNPNIVARHGEVTESKKGPPGAK